MNGFPTPWAHWLAGPQLDDLEKLLLESRNAGASLIEPSVVRKLFVEHRGGRRDNGDRIWRLLNLEIWHRVLLMARCPMRNQSHRLAAVSVTDSANKTEIERT